MSEKITLTTTVDKKLLDTLKSIEAEFGVSFNISQVLRDGLEMRVTKIKEKFNDKK